MKKIFIIDTNILLDDPNVIETLRNHEENIIVVPYSVICEMDRLKSNINKSHLVSIAMDKIINDNKIIIVRREDFKYSKDICRDETIIDDVSYFLKFISKYITSDYLLNQCIFVSNDKILRYRVQIELNLTVQEYKGSQPFQSDAEIYTGYIRKDDEVVKNCFILNDNKIWWEKTESFIDENEIWKIKPKTIYQNMLMQLLLDDDIKVVSVNSQAGFGKTLLALAAAIQLTQQKNFQIKKEETIITEDGEEIVVDKPKKRGRKKKNEHEPKPSQIYKKIFVVRPTTIIGEELGFLPGDLSEKIDPYFRPIKDLIIKLHENRPCNRLFIDGDPKKGFDRNVIEFLPVTYIRGMNLDNCIVVGDEIQNLSRSECKSLLSRMGENVRCFITGDIHQVDSKYLNSSNNGLNWIVRKFKGQPEYGHITLKGPKSRGPIADLVIKTNL